MSDTKLYRLVSLDLPNRNIKLHNQKRTEERRKNKYNLHFDSLVTVWKLLNIFIVIMWRNSCGSWTSFFYFFAYAGAKIFSLDMNMTVKLFSRILREEIHRKADLLSFNLNMFSLRSKVVQGKQDTVIVTFHTNALNTHKNQKDWLTRRRSV